MSPPPHLPLSSKPGRELCPARLAKSLQRHSADNEHVQELTLRSPKQLINQLVDEIARRVEGLVATG